MYKNELDQKIKNRTLPKSILLYGEAYFTDSYAKEIAGMLGGKENVLSFYFDEYHFESAKNFLSQPSLFGDESILYLRSEKKIAKKELDIFVGLCHKNPTSYFIFHVCGDDALGKEMSASFNPKNSADFVRFFEPKPHEALPVLQKKARELGLEIDNYALSHLFAKHDEDLLLSTNELSKLLLLSKKITTADIDRHVYGMGEISLDDFIQKLLGKEEMREDAQRLLESGNFDEVQIINAIEGYFVQLFMFHAYIKVHGKYEIVDIVGYPLPMEIAKVRATQATKISTPVFHKILKHLLETEHALKKQTHIDKNSYLLSALLRLQSYLL